MSEKHRTPEHHVHAYDRMLERVKGFMEQAEKDVLPKLRNAIDAAQEKAVELGELTREEAEKIGDYLQRDIEDAAHYLDETGRELADWARIDMLLVEARLADLFSQVADKTRIELSRLAMESEINEWHTGEVTGIGRLRCMACGEELEFHETGHIPPCPKCPGTRFQRIRTGESGD